MHSIINLNHLPIINKFNSIIIIEQHNELLTELIMINKKVDKRGFTQSVIPSYDIKQLPIIPFGNVHNYSKKTPTVYSGYSLKTETRKIPQLNTQPKLQSQNKESNPSYLGVASSSNGIDYTILMDPKPKK